jgi:hypothetical protein
LRDQRIKLVAGCWIEVKHRRCGEENNMLRKSYFLNRGPFASGEEMARLAINSDWTCNTHDPRNACYLRPLSRAADEEMAHLMADAIYDAVAEKYANNRTFNSDDVYLQASSTLDACWVIANIGASSGTKRITSGGLFLAR